MTRRTVMRTIFIFILLLILALTVLIQYAQAAMGPQIYEVTCNKVTFVWTDPPEPPDIGPFPGSLYIQKLGGFQEVYNIYYDRFISGNWWYVTIEGEPSFEENAIYRLDGFLKGGVSHGLYNFINGDTYWSPCRKMRIRIPLITKG